MTERLMTELPLVLYARLEGEDFDDGGILAGATEEEILVDDGTAVVVGQYRLVGVRRVTKESRVVECPEPQ